MVIQKRSKTKDLADQVKEESDKVAKQIERHKKILEKNDAREKRKKKGFALSTKNESESSKVGVNSDVKRNSKYYTEIEPNGKTKRIVKVQD